jgi:hypothetical protein
MKITQPVVDMLRISTEFARDAIKMSALINTGATACVFSQAPAKSIWFILGTGCFVLGIISCAICAIMTYITQWEYGNAVRNLEIGKLKEYYKSNASGHKRRYMGLAFLILSLVFFFFGCLITAYGWINVISE